MKNGCEWHENQRATDAEQFPKLPAQQRPVAQLMAHSLCSQGNQWKHPLRTMATSVACHFTWSKQDVHDAPVCPCGFYLPFIIIIYYYICAARILQTEGQPARTQHSTKCDGFPATTRRPTCRPAKPRLRQPLQGVKASQNPVGPQLFSTSSSSIAGGRGGVGRCLPKEMRNKITMSWNMNRNMYKEE